MSKEVTAIQNGSSEYESDTLENIRQALLQLRTVDQLVKELIQNADDAGASTFSLNFDEHGLLASNNALLNSCSSPREHSRTCTGNATRPDNKFCDVHAIKRVASGNKRDSSTTTGKFGIGFVSIYLVTDRPVLRSKNIQMDFLPEHAQITISTEERNVDGTQLWMPWAKIADSEFRQAIVKDCPKWNDLQDLVETAKETCRESFLFLRNLKHVTISLDTKPQLALSKSETSTESWIVVKDELDHSEQKWFSLKGAGDEELSLSTFRESHHEFRTRRTDIEILVPDDLQFGTAGRLFATLATNNHTYLPLHINADFYPHQSRATLLFPDEADEPQARWNAHVIATSAKLLARSIPLLSAHFGHDTTWQVLRSAHKISTRHKDTIPACFRAFWTEVQAEARKHKLVLCDESELHAAHEVVSLPSTSIEHGRVTAKHLNIHFQNSIHDADLTILRELGSPIISQEILCNALQRMHEEERLNQAFSKKHWDDIYLPFLHTVDSLIATEGGLNPKLALLKIWPSDEYECTKHADLIGLKNKSTAKICHDIAPSLLIAHSALSELQHIAETLRDLTEESLYLELCKADNLNHLHIAIHSRKSNHSVFDFIFDTIHPEKLPELGIKRWVNISMWPLSDGQFSTLHNTLLPGGFSDPIGIGDLLDSQYFSEQACQHLQKTFEIGEMTFTNYITQLLPKFVEDRGITQQYAFAILKTIANPPIPMQPDMWEAMSKIPLLNSTHEVLLPPKECLLPTDRLRNLFDDSQFHFVDMKQFKGLENTDSEVELLLSNLRVIDSPSIEMVIRTWLSIQNTTNRLATNKNQLERLLGEVLALLSKVDRSSQKWTGIQDLRFPCADNCPDWHSPSDVIHKHWHNALCSAERMHTIALSMSKSNIRLAEDLLGIGERPPLLQIIEHLRHSVQDQKSIDPKVDEILEHYARNGDAAEKNAIRELRTEPCLYVPSENLYLRPSDIYSHIPEHLAFLRTYIHEIEMAPEDHASLWHLFNIPNVLAEEDITTYLPCIQADIIEFGAEPKLLNAYENSLAVIGAAFLRNEAWAKNYVEKFAAFDFLMTRDENWASPQSVVIVDSHFWAEQLQDEAADVLVDVDPVVIEFLRSAGSETLSAAMTVHSDELTFEIDAMNAEISQILQKHHEIIKSVFSRIIVENRFGGRSRATDLLPKLDKFHAVEVAQLTSIEVGVTVRTAGQEQRFELYDVPRLYIPNSNVALISSNHLQLLNALHAILFYLIPDVPESDYKGTLTTLEQIILRALPLEEAFVLLEERDLIDSDINYSLSEERPVAVLEFNKISSTEPMAREPDIEESHSKPSPAETPSASDDDPDVDLDRMRPDIDLSSQPERRRSLPEEKNKPTNSSQTPASESRTLISYSDKEAERKSTPSTTNPDASNQDHRRSSGRPHSNTDAAQQTKRPSANRGRAKSGYTYAEADRQESNGNLRNMSLEEAGIQYVLGLDWEIRRTITDANLEVRNNPGYDLLSVADDDPEDVRYIELKCLRGEWNEFGVGVTSRQLEKAQEYGSQYWLYVLEYAGDSALARLHRIHDPWSHIRRIYFDDGWREIAEVSRQQNPPQLWPGLMFIHPEHGKGTIVADPRHQGHGVYCQVQFDSAEEPKRILWDNDFEVLETRRDDS